MLTVTITTRTKLFAQTYLVVRDQKSDRAGRFESEIFATSGFQDCAARICAYLAACRTLTALTPARASGSGGNLTSSGRMH
jgi:hypothetical protein